MNGVSQVKRIWYIYDGECPLCRSAASALRIKQDYGQLHLVNARESEAHELVAAIKQLQLDLDEGMVIYDGEHVYHGKDALVRFTWRYQVKQKMVREKQLCLNSLRSRAMDQIFPVCLRLY